MDSQAKLTRTQSSLLRSVRSSIHSLSSISETDLTTKSHHRVEPQDEESRGGGASSEEKPRMKPPRRTGSSHRTTGLSRFRPVAYLSSFTLLSLVVFFFYLGRDEIPTSENLLIALIFVAVTLFLASKNKTLINQLVATVKQLWCEKLGLLSHKSHHDSSKPVRWFIGEPRPESHEIRRGKKVMMRETVEYYSNGDLYEGEFDNKGKCNGTGVYYYFMKGKYEGDWIQGRYDGFGIESWAKGSKYKGQYRQGSRHGHGVYRFYTGDSYSGEWCNGQSHGVGVQTCADGSCYVGEFKFGVKHGLGHYHFRNGDMYAGEYFGDKMHGFGVYHFANGHCYEGAWHEGRKQGNGMYTFRNGVTKCGKWDSGHLKTPIAPPLTGSSVHRAVQAARERAENAKKHRRVDERVSNAEMAANRAATAARVAAIKAVQNQIDGTFGDMDG